MDRNASRIRVGVADMAVTGNGETLVTSGLGSCVAVGMYDEHGHGGLLHAMLPEAPAEPVPEAKYVDSGIEALCRDLADLGATRESMTAKVAGGSRMLDIGNGDPVGDRNVAATERALQRADVEVAGTDTGGGSGRSVTFVPATGTMRIEQVDADPIDL